jgi:hypothetical protein
MIFVAFIHAASTFQKSSYTTESAGNRIVGLKYESFNYIIAMTRGARLTARLGRTIIDLVTFRKLKKRSNFAPEQAI